LDKALDCIANFRESFVTELRSSAQQMLEFAPALPADGEANATASS
jgi:hypothetical protein